MSKAAMVNRRLKIKPPVVDYRKWRPSVWNSGEFKHLQLLLYWPIYGVLFLFVERFYQVEFYYPVQCSIDTMIPFCEYFVIPYLFWFVYLIGMHIYTLLYDIESFKKMMKFIILTYSITILVYLIFPTCQELRPASFDRSDIFTRFLSGFYQFDTNTNVCPSIHVIGSLAVMFTAFHCEHLKGAAWKIGFAVTAFFICASTVFLKQHSIIDVLAAVPVSLLGDYVCFVRTKKHNLISQNT